MVIEKNMKEEKSGHGCLIAFLIFFLLFVSIIGGGYWVYKKITSGLSKQVDLNVVYSHSDADLFTEAFETTTLNAVKSGAVVDDSLSMDLSFTSEQASALVDKYISNIAFVSLENTQIKFTEEFAMVSTLVDYGKYSIPLYVAGDIDTTVNKKVSVNLYDAKLGDIRIPQAIQDYIENALDEYINERLNGEDVSFNVENIVLGDNVLTFKGLIPINLLEGE